MCSTIWGTRRRVYPIPQEAAILCVPAYISQIEIVCITVLEFFKAPSASAINAWVNTTAYFPAKLERADKPHLGVVIGQKGSNKLKFVVIVSSRKKAFHLSPSSVTRNS